MFPHKIYHMSSETELELIMLKLKSLAVYIALFIKPEEKTSLSRLFRCLSFSLLFRGALGKYVSVVTCSGRVCLRQPLSGGIFFLRPFTFNST